MFHRDNNSICQLLHISCNMATIYHAQVHIVTILLKPKDSFGICGENQMKLFSFIES